jgi:hypothetical protein
MKERHPCPCCGYLTMPEPPPGTYSVCPVCYWEDDGAQFEDPSYEGGANSVSLSTARENFRRFGASCAEVQEHTRPPLAVEIP